MFLKKTLHNPAKKPSSHKARRTPHGDLHPAVCVRSPARPRASRNSGLRPRRRPRRRLSGSWSMQVGAAAAAAHLRNVFARAGVDSPPACLPAGSHNGSGCSGRPSGLGMHNNSARRCADRAVNRGRRSICLGNRRPGDGLGTAVTLGHRRVQPNAGAPRARPARAVRFASMHGSGAVWPAQGGPTRVELQRARRRRGQVRRRSRVIRRTQQRVCVLTAWPAVLGSCRE